MRSVAPEPFAAEEQVLDADIRLVTLAREDSTEFAELYRRYLSPVYAYCWRRLGSREAAEDATSQIFVKALVALPQYRGDRSFRSWLFAIAHNEVVDHYRAQRPSRPLEDASQIADRTESPEDLGILAADGAALRALLSRLTPDQEQIIELRLAGLSETEIAQVLNRRPGAIRATQFRALGRLRLLLGASPAQGGDAHV